MSADGHAWIERLPAELSGQQAILGALVRACESSDGISWLVVACSVGRGAADRLSDLDLGMGVADDQFDAMLAEVHRIVDRLGDLVESYRHELAHGTRTYQRIFAQYADRCQVDLVVIPASQSVGPVRDEVVLYNSGGYRSEPFEQRPVPPEQVREWAFAGWCALADLGKYWRRGSGWEALSRLNDARAELWRLRAVASGVANPGFGLTSLLDFAPDQVPREMEATVSDLDRARMLAAARSLARQLAEVSATLPAEHRDALPSAMASFVTSDLDALAASRRDERTRTCSS